MSDSKDKEPDVLFVGDSLIQLMHQFGVNRLHIVLILVLCAALEYLLLLTDMAAAVLSSSCPEFWCGW